MLIVKWCLKIMPQFTSVSVNRVILYTRKFKSIDRSYTKNMMMVIIPTNLQSRYICKHIELKIFQTQKQMFFKCNYHIQLFEISRQHVSDVLGPTTLCTVHPFTNLMYTLFRCRCTSFQELKPYLSTM